MASSFSRGLYPRKNITFVHIFRISVFNARLSIDFFCNFVVKSGLNTGLRNRFGFTFKRESKLKNFLFLIKESLWRPLVKTHKKLKVIGIFSLLGAVVHR